MLSRIGRESHLSDKAMSWLLNLISCVLLGATQAELPKVQWTGGSNIQWPCTTTRDVYKEGGKYINKNVIATRATIYKDDAFLALPRYFNLIIAGLRKEDILLIFGFM